MNDNEWSFHEEKEYCPHCERANKLDNGSRDTYHSLFDECVKRRYSEPYEAYKKRVGEVIKKMHKIETKKLLKK